MVRGLRGREAGARSFLSPTSIEGIIWKAPHHVFVLLPLWRSYTMEKALGLAAEWPGELCSAAGTGRAARAGAGLAVPQFPAVSLGQAAGHCTSTPRTQGLASSQSGKCEAHVKVHFEVGHSVRACSCSVFSALLAIVLPVISSCCSVGISKPLGFCVCPSRSK